MLPPIEHDARIAGIRARLDETALRLTARLETVADLQPPPRAWSAAQISAHVALVNENLASAIDGTTGRAGRRCLM